MTGVPHHSKDYIERRTESTLRRFVPAALTEAQPTPLGDIAARVSEQLGATFHFDQELGLTSQGSEGSRGVPFRARICDFRRPLIAKRRRKRTLSVHSCA